MSEKQARIKRKSTPQEELPKKKGSALFGWIAAVLIIAFLGLAGYALKDNIKALIPEKPEKEATVSDLAKDRDMTADEFIEEFELSDSDITEKSTESEVVSKLTVKNYAKYTDKTVDELLTENGIEGATEDMLWQDAYLLTPMSKYAESMGMTFEDLKSQAGLPDEIKETTTLSDAQEIIAAQQEAAAAEEETEDETDTAEDKAE